MKNINDLLKPRYGRILKAGEHPRVGEFVTYYSGERREHSYYIIGLTEEGWPLAVHSQSNYERTNEFKSFTVWTGGVIQKPPEELYEKYK